MSGSDLGLADLAARRLGGMVLSANDEFFAAKENLLDPRPPTFDDIAYCDRGKIMDGWETRRRRGPGSDWCIVRLGVPGRLEVAVVDTSFFRGNHPESCELWGTASPAIDSDSDWFPLVPRTELRGDALHRIAIDCPRRVTHVRFVIVPDGGVARLRLLGQPLPDLHGIADPGDRLDLAALVNGGAAVACSDAFFSPPSNLIMIGDARDMSDGWETRRRRGPGADWAVVRLATTGVVERIEIDTTHFKGNYPERCSVLALAVSDTAAATLPDDGWTVLVDEQEMQPHARHVIAAADAVEATHLKLVVQPDGGVARLRAFGRITDDGWRRNGVAMLDAAGESEALPLLKACCGSRAWAEQMLSRRPFHTPAALLAAADEVWARMEPADHMEAFSAHPRIGERTGSAWSQREQAGTATADAEVRRRLAEGNVAYEQRFGHVFLIRAAGRSAAEMLSELERRMHNDPHTERTVAAEQQRQITALRLQTLLREGWGGGDR